MIILALVSERVNVFLSEIQNVLNEVKPMYEIYKTLRDEKGVSDYQVAKETGINRSTFTDWKSGRSSPKQDKLRRLAAYFNVTMEYLTGSNSPHVAISEQEQEVLALFRKLNATGKNEALKRVSELAELPKYTDKGKKSSTSKIG